jgi:hypothetical protein
VQGPGVAHSDRKRYPQAIKTQIRLTAQSLLQVNIDRNIESHPCSIPLPSDIGSHMQQSVLSSQPCDCEFTKSMVTRTIDRSAPQFLSTLSSIDCHKLISCRGPELAGGNRLPASTAGIFMSTSPLAFMKLWYHRGNRNLTCPHTNTIR